MNTTSNPNYTIHTALDHGEGGIVYQQDETFLQGMTPVPSAATSDYLLTEQPQGDCSQNIYYKTWALLT